MKSHAKLNERHSFSPVSTEAAEQILLHTVVVTQSKHLRRLVQTAVPLSSLSLPRSSLVPSARSAVTPRLRSPPAPPHVKSLCCPSSGPDIRQEDTQGFVFAFVAERLLE